VKCVRTYARIGLHGNLLDQSDQLHQVSGRNQKTTTKENITNMSISLQKLQELFNSRLDLSNELAQVEQRIREMMGESVQSESAGAQDSTRPKRGRKPRASVVDGSEIGDTNHVDGATAVEAPSSPAVAPTRPTAVGFVLLSSINPGTQYSGAEIYQATLDLSSPDTDPVGLKAAVKSEIRSLVESGHLAKSGEGPATRYTKTC
jgi:hypothetical protein